MAANGVRPDLVVQLDRSAETPLYQQLHDEIAARIAAGAIEAGVRLPPERTLATALDVNRSTVVAAYQLLKRDGVVSGHVGRGTIVLPRRSAAPTGSVSWEAIVRTDPAASDPLIRDLLDTDHSGVISLTLGLPATDVIPVAELREVLDRVLAERGAEALLHSPTEGTPELREVLAERLSSDGRRCRPSQVLVTSGAQQALDLITKAYLGPGDVVLADDPGYLGALLAFRRAGARIVGVPFDADGMRLDSLDSIIMRRRPKLIYTGPTFQNPTGFTMPAARRQHLVDIAARHHVPIVEEDAYSELRYEGDPLPSLFSLDKTGGVLYVGTMSKQLCPGLRVGWIAGPEAALRPLIVEKQTADLHTGTLAQLVVARFIAEGRQAQHLQRARREYAKRRDALVEALERHVSDECTWAVPNGGFYLWCRLPDGVSLPGLVAEATREGVTFLPGSVFSAGEGGAHHIRLNFSGTTAPRLREGAERLARALDSAAAGRSPRSLSLVGARPIV